MKKQMKLLCIDDDRSLLKMFRKFFERLGYTVFTAENGKEGLKTFHDQKPDIVLVDLKMPEVSGFEVLETIMEESSDIPVLVISGEGEMADVIQALRLGAWNYQTKPINNLNLIQHAVEQALGSIRFSFLDHDYNLKPSLSGTLNLSTFL
jgi:DNA-binding NtrC family response regulator